MIKYIVLMALVILSAFLGFYHEGTLKGVIFIVAQCFLVLLIAIEKARDTLEEIKVIVSNNTRLADIIATKEFKEKLDNS